MIDIVHRLYATSNSIGDTTYSGLLREAADEIERLRAIINNVALSIGVESSNAAQKG